MKAFLTVCLFFGSLSFAMANPCVDPLPFSFNAELTGKNLPFLRHTGPGPFDNALALNLPYAPVAALREQLQQRLSLKLDHFRGWDPAGEAHVTVITPPEFSKILSRFVTMENIHSIAVAEKIQQADLTLLAMGSGRKKLSGKEEETFFLIVDSLALRRIRTKIWQLYVERGGAPGDWDPSWFFPHITVGYTSTDLHEPDVLKNIEHAYDCRFQLNP